MDELILRSSAKENEAVVFLIKGITNKIKDINNVLLNESGIDMEKRERLLDSKALLWWIIERFGNPKHEMDMLEKELDDQIDYYKSTYSSSL